MSDPWDLSQPEERHLAAGEYSLGALGGEQKARFEALLAVSHDLQNEVATWQEHLQLFNERLDPRQPPAEVWKRITAATGTARPPWWHSLALWRSASIGFAALAITFGLLWQQPVGLPTPLGSAVFVVQDESRTPGWIISATAEGELIVQTVQPDQVGADQTGELWLIDNGTPVSLGLLPESGQRSLSPSPDLRARLMTADLAVSIEPRGGAPEGQPTGPIIDHGRMTPMRKDTLDL
jgi:anti-sigma-K factor RskA